MLGEIEIMYTPSSLASHTAKTSHLVTWMGRCYEY